MYGSNFTLTFLLQESIPAVAEGLKELSQLVCELCVPMSATSWNLLLTYMMDIGDLYQTVNLLSLQVSYYQSSLFFM